MYMPRAPRSWTASQRRPWRNLALEGGSSPQESFPSAPDTNHDAVINGTPTCSPDRASLQYSGGSPDSGPGWLLVDTILKTAINRRHAGPGARASASASLKARMGLQRNNSCFRPASEKCPSCDRWMDNARTRPRPALPPRASRLKYLAGFPCPSPSQAHTLAWRSRQPFATRSLIASSFDPDVTRAGIRACKA